MSQEPNKFADQAGRFPAGIAGDAPSRFVDEFSFPDPPPPVDAGVAEKRMGELLAYSSISPSQSDGPGSRKEKPRSARRPGADSKVERPEIAGYELLQELGRGGMGIVYLARQVNPRRSVALKIILAGPLANEHALARFRRETAIIGRLQHTNIVPIFEVSESGNRPYFTMEYLSGGNLAQKLAKASISASETADLVETLARAMQAAHEAGFVHRDLKPSNVLLAADGTPKISDFGLAKELGDPSASAPDALTATGAILGTPNYMAPEQASGESSAKQDPHAPARFGPAVDVYGLGAILYECLTGLPPFRAATVLETLDLVRSRDPIPPRRYQPNVPRDLQTICLKCLEKHPLKRYASASALADDLGRFGRGEPIRAVPVSAVGRLVKWSRRRPAWAALWLLLILVAVGSTAGIAYHTSQLQKSVNALSASEANVRQAKEQADVNYREARETIHRMLQHSEDRVRQSAIPQLRDLVAQQAEDALQFFRAAAAKTPEPDPAFQFELASALSLVGRQRGLLGNRDQAANLLREALQAADSLPATPSNQFLRGQLHLILGENMIGVSANVAEEEYRKARSIFDGIKDLPPSQGNLDFERGACRHQLAILYRQTNRYREAENQLREALKIWDVAFANPAVVPPIWLNRKVDSFIMLGLVLYHEKEYPASRLAYTEAEQWCKEVRKRLPNDLDVVASLATLYLDWGLLDEAEDKNDDALRHYSAAIDLLEPALLREPNMVRLRVPARNAHGARGDLRRRLDQFGGQAEDVHRYNELGPALVPFALRLAETTAWARGGNHVKAMADLENILANPQAKLTWSHYRELAAVAAAAIKGAQSDTKLSSAEKAATIDRYAAKGIEFLETALHAVDAENAGKLRKELATDTRLAPLRQRPGFPKK